MKPESIEQNSLTCDNFSIIRNEFLCSEHFLMVLEGKTFPAAQPGQFVMIRSASEVGSPPFYLRRAFSISGIQRVGDRVQVEILYRAIGRATRWMRTLQSGLEISVAGPLGKPFPLPTEPKKAWFVGGGVGLPPVMWMAQHTAEQWESGIVYAGSQSKGLLPLDILEDTPPSSDPASPVVCSREFVESNVPAVICTDDGSVGYHGTVLDAMKQHWDANPCEPSSLVIYACGPEPMLAAIQEWASGKGIKTFLSMEREMACGMGTCQSCVVPVRSEEADDGWGYHLCCKDGPVFEGDRIIWQDPQKR